MSQQTNLTSFEALPNTAFVRQPTVKLLYACSAPTVWRWVKKGLIPKPHRIGGTTVWSVGDLRESLAAIKEKKK